MLWLLPETQGRLVIVLLHFLWQAPVIAALLIAAVRVLKIERPASRYAASTCAFLLMASLPIVTWFLVSNSRFETPIALRDQVQRLESPSMSSSSSSPNSSTNIASGLADRNATSSSTDRRWLDPVELQRSGAPSSRSQINVPFSVTSSRDQSLSTSWWMTIRTWEPWIVASWLSGVVLLSFRLILGAIGLSRWRRAAMALPESLEPIVMRLCTTLQMTPPTVRLCRRLSDAVAMGFIKPIILLPASWVTELPIDMLEAVIAHELAHLRRLDLWVNLFQRFVETLLFFHPVVWWLSRRVRFERELCCDELAATAINNPVRYAETLEHVARISHVGSVPSLALAISSTSRDGVLLRRVKQLLEPMPKASTRNSWWVGLLVIGLVVSPALGKLVSLQAGPQGTFEAQEEPKPMRLTADELAAENAAKAALSAMPGMLFQVSDSGRDVTLFNAPPEAWPYVGQLVSLETLQVEASDVRGEPMEQIGRLRHLRELQIINSKCNPQDLAALRDVTSLERLEVMCWIFEESSEWRSQAIGDLAAEEQQILTSELLVQQPRPEHLLQAAILTDRALEQLQALQRLKSVKLINTTVGPRGVERLAALPLLTELEINVLYDDTPNVQRTIGSIKSLKSLSGLSLSDAALAQWSNLDQLESLEHFAGDLSDVGAERLLKFSRLKRLVLWHNQLTDQGLLRLAELPNLETLDLRFSKRLTAEGIAAFQARRPRCLVTHSLEDPAQEAEAAWGEVSNGLRMRVVPVLASMDETQVDLTQRVDSFETLDDVAFAVELQNVSDRPVSISELKYGEHYGDSKGTAASDWFAQFLFTLDYFDEAGRLIERPEFIPVGGQSRFIDSGTLKTALEPEQSITMLLRPNRWLSVLSQRPRVGTQRVVLKYRGLVAEDQSNLPIEVVSPEVDIHVKSRGYGEAVKEADELFDVAANASESEDQWLQGLAWGEPNNGLRAALELIPPSGLSGFSHGSKAKLRLIVQNVSVQPITLASQMWLSELPVKVSDAAGNDVEVGSVWYSGITPVIRLQLKPGQLVAFDAGNLGLAVTKERAEAFEHVTHRTLVAPQGEYVIRATERFGFSFLLKDGEGNVLAPLEGDLKTELTTGGLSFKISNERVPIEIVDRVTGKPVSGTTVNFRFVKPAANGSEEEIVADSFFGPQAESNVYFWIPEFPEDLAQRVDRDELVVRISVGGHPDYEDYSSPEPISLMEFFHKGPVTALELLKKIELTPKSSN